MTWPSVAVWWAKNLMHAERKKWVMFQHGSVVIFIDRSDDKNDTLIRDAIDIMKEDGPVMPGSSFGDFSTISLDDGYVVTSHNPNLVTVKEGILDGENDLSIGLTLRSQRNQDSENPVVIATSIEK